MHSDHHASHAPMRFQGRLRDLGKLYPYNKLLPQLFDNPAVIGATCNYYDQLAGGCAGCKLFFFSHFASCIGGKLLYNDRKS